MGHEECVILHSGRFSWNHYLWTGQAQRGDDALDIRLHFRELTQGLGLSDCAS